MEISKYQVTDALKDAIKLKFDLPLKYAEKKKNKSLSNKSVGKTPF
jgi:hypothetical protein